MSLRDTKIRGINSDHRSAQPEDAPARQNYHNAIRGSRSQTNVQSSVTVARCADEGKQKD